MLRLLLLLLPWPALACEWVDQVRVQPGPREPGGLRLMGPLPSVAPDTLPERGGPVAEPPCGVVTIDAHFGTWLAEAEVDLRGRASLQVAFQGAARVFWDGRLLGGQDDLRPFGTTHEAFVVTGTGRHTVLVELRPPANTRIHLGMRLVPLKGDGPLAALQGRITLPPPAALPPRGPVNPPPPLTEIPRTRRPPMPGVDREYLYDFHEVHILEGWHRRRYALRILTPAGLAASRHLPHPGPRERAVGDVVVGEVVTHDAPVRPEGLFAPELPTWDWRVELITDRSTPVFARARGTAPGTVLDVAPGIRHHRWQATAALPGTTHLRVGPAPDPARWRAALLAHFDAMLTPGLGEQGEVPEIAHESPAANLAEDDLLRAAHHIRRLRASGAAAWPLLVRPAALGPLPDGPPVAADFPEVWVQGPGGLLPMTPGATTPAGTLLPFPWRLPVYDMPAAPAPAAPLGGLCAKPIQPLWTRCTPAQPGLQPLEIKTDFAHYRREIKPATGCGTTSPGAGLEVIHRLEERRPTGDALARARFCRAVAAALAEAP